MFCANCGSKVIPGDRFCVTCGKAQRPASALESGAIFVQEAPAKLGEQSFAVQTIAETPPVDQTVTSGVAVAEPGGEPLYCRHSPSERTNFGADRQRGSVTCLSCKLPYFPGSPNFLPSVVARRTGQVTVKNKGGGVPQQAPLVPRPPFSGEAIWAFLLSVLWLGGLGSVLAIPLAWWAMDETQRGTRSGQGLAVAALILGILGVISTLWCMAFIFWG